jgi:hypothetical protein
LEPVERLQQSFVRCVPGHDGNAQVGHPAGRQLLATADERSAHDVGQLADSSADDGGIMLAVHDDEGAHRASTSREGYGTSAFYF